MCGADPQCERSSPLPMEGKASTGLSRPAIWRIWVEGKFGKLLSLVKRAEKEGEGQMGESAEEGKTHFHSVKGPLEVCGRKCKSLVSRAVLLEPQSFQRKS